jgi:dipeptidyl-peptidase-4
MNLKYYLKVISFSTLCIPFFAQAQKTITVEDVYQNGTFRAKGVRGFNSLNDGETYCKFERSEDGSELVKYSFATDEKVGVIFKSSEVKDPEGEQIPIQGYSFSSDESQILISTGVERIYRHSTRAFYYVFDLATKKTTRVSSDKVMYATISPNGKYVAYVENNNLFHFNIETGTTQQVTQDGDKNSIINGAVDWVYEEEFSMSRGFEWSPNGEYIAFYRFDESEVPEFSMDMYGSLYPRKEVWKYPKAGERNSVVDVYVYSLASGTSVKCEVGSENDQYIPRIKWTKDNNTLSIQRLNRHQNHWELLFANASTGKINVVLEEKNKYYVDISDNLTFLNDGNSVIYTSEKDGFNHIYIYNFTNKKETQVTKGMWDVTSFHGINEKAKTVYFNSSEVSATERHLYSIKSNGKGKKKLTAGSGFHSVTFSSGLKYYLENYSYIDRAPEYSMHSANGEQIQILEDNSDLNALVDEYKLSETEFDQLTTSYGVTLNFWMIKPPNFDPNKKYPMLMYVYGGPGINTVNNRWGGHYFWYQMLAQKGYIVVSVDARGTGFRGEEFKKMTYMQLGNYESMDQIASAKYFGNMPFVDESRIGIWGWSYGGYMSSLCLAKGNDVFKMGIAVAPVTNWRYYDNIYTERFMRTPQENEQGYDTNSPINHVEKIKGNYLIVHGTADDNVHFQNAVEMVSAMISKNVAFDSEFYPNKNHGIYGGMTRLHLFTRLTNYIEENL